MQAEGTRRMELLSWDQAAALIERSGIAIVPVGAIEPHGHHAPLGADTFIAQEISERLAEKVDGIVFPAIPLGVMNLVYDFRYMPGTISIDAKLLIDLYTNIGTELGRTGVRRLVFVNGHGPNAAVLGIASYKIRDQVDTEVGLLEWWTTSHSEIESIKGFGFGNHGDEIETSLMLATAEAAAVNLSNAVINSPKLEGLSPAESALYHAKIPFTRTLDDKWVGTSGNMGDPTKATREKGNRIIDRAVTVGVQLLDVLEEQRRRRSAPAKA